MRDFCQDTIKMATDDRLRKHSRLGVWFQMEFHFEDNGAKQKFQDRVESIKLQETINS